MTTEPTRPRSSPSTTPRASSWRCRASLAELGREVVRRASSGREALRLLLRHEFAVILLDVHMPGMDGFETASLIRQRQNSEHTPIIFVTAYPRRHARRPRLLARRRRLHPGTARSRDPAAKVGVFVELFRKTAQIAIAGGRPRAARPQLQRLTQASLAINSALSPGETLQVVAELARDILGAHQAVAIAAPDLKWNAARSGVALSRRNTEGGETPILRDREALVALLSDTRGPIRRPAGGGFDGRYFADDQPDRLGWIAAPLTGRDGRPIGLLHLLEKVDGEFDGDDEAVLTQLAQLSSIAIENAINAEAREANRMKDEFLTTLSHELRTPLAAILGWTRLLRSDGLDSRRRDDALEVIERNVLAQTKLIDDMLDVSRIITGKLGLSVRSTNLSAVIRAAMDSMRPAADGKQIEMSFSTPLRRGRRPGLSETPTACSRSSGISSPTRSSSRPREAGSR